jgi:trimethylamine--corrinoid protein Co-methyltransferase
MAKAKTVFLSQQEMDLIHAQRIKSLQEIDIKVHSKPVLEILERNGANVDDNTTIAKIPEKMVSLALESVQREFTLSARDPKLDLLNMDKKEVPAEANKIVKSILDKHQVDPIANDLIEKGDASIAKDEDTVGN